MWGGRHLEELTPNYFQGKKCLCLGKYKSFIMKTWRLGDNRAGDSTAKEKAKVSFVRSNRNGEIEKGQRKGSGEMPEPRSRVVKALESTSVQYSILSVYIAALLQPAKLEKNLLPYENREFFEVEKD